MEKINLADGQSFRWGGIEHNFAKTAKEWQEGYVSFDPSENPYVECFCCKQKYGDNEYLYAGFMALDNGMFQLKTFCKKCAYKISKTVIEADGTACEGENTLC